MIWFCLLFLLILILVVVRFAIQLDKAEKTIKSLTTDLRIKEHSAEASHKAFLNCRQELRDLKAVAKELQTASLIEVNGLKAKLTQIKEII